MNVGEVVASITAKLDGLKTGMAEAKSLFSNSIDNMKNAATSLAPGMKNIDNAVKETDNNLKEFKDSSKSTQGALEGFGSSLKSSAVNIENLDKKQQLWLVSNKSSASALEVNNKAVETNKSKLTELVGQISKGKEALETLKTTLGSTSNEYKQAENSVMSLEIAYKGLEKETLSLESKSKELEKSANPGFFDKLKNNIVGIKDTTQETGQKVQEAATKTKTSIIGSAQAAIAWGSATIGSAMGAYKMAESASNLNEAQNVVEQTFKNSSKSIEDWTTTTAKSAGISQTASTQWSGFMGAMLKASGVTEQSSASMSKSLVQLTGDMSSFYNVSTDEMWEKIRSGISGETMPLKELGINMDVANLSAYALSQGIHTAYDKMTQAQQTTLRYNYLMSVTKDAQGDFGRTLSTSFANQVRVAEMNVGMLGRSIGSGLLPMFLTGVTFINGHMPQIQSTLTSVVSNVKNTITAAAPIVSGIIQDVGKIATDLFPSLAGSSGNLGKQISSLVVGGLNILKTVLDWMAQHGTVVSTAIVGITSALIAFKAITLASIAAQEIHNGLLLIGALRSGGLAAAKLALASANGSATAAQWLLNAAEDANPVGAIIMLIVALIAVIVYLWNTNTGFRNAVINIFSGIKNFFVGLWSWIVPFFKQWGIVILACLMPVVGIPILIYQHWGQIKNFFTSLFSGVGATFNSWGNSARNFFVSIWNNIKNTFTSVITAIKAFVNATFGKMITDIKIIMFDLNAMFGAVWDIIKTIFLGAILLILDLVTGNFTQLKKDAQNIWNSIVEDFQGIWAAIQIIFNTALDLIKNVASMTWNSIVTIATTIWNGFVSFMTALWNGIVNTAVSAWNGLRNAVVSIATAIVQGAINIFNGIINFFANLPGTLYNLGSNAFNSLRSGISNVMGTIGSVVSGGFNSAISYITSLPGRAYSWGVDFINGLTNGIRSAIGGVENAVSGVADKIRSFLHFSVPDEGPLADADQYGGDFMDLIANGISKGKNNVMKAVNSVATSLQSGIKVGLNPSIAGIGSVSGIANPSTTNNSNLYGALLHVDKLILNNDMDIQALSNKLEFYRQQVSTGKGVK